MEFKIHIKPTTIMVLTTMATRVAMIGASFPGRQLGTARISSSSRVSTSTEEIDMGTTLVALKCKNGVIVGADTQTSASTYVSNRFARKLDSLLFGIHEQHHDGDDSDLQFDGSNETIVYDGKNVIQSSCVIARSGSAADTQFLVKYVAREFSTSPRWTRVADMPHFHHSPTISQVAHFLRYLVRETNDPEDGSGGNHGPLQASLICAGYDETCKKNVSGGGRIFAITPGGTLLEEPMVSVSGSGSTYLLGHLDQVLKQRQLESVNDDPSGTSSSILLDEDEAIDLVVQLIRLSISRDASSGGWIRIVVINGDGQRHLTFPPTIQPSESIAFVNGSNRRPKDGRETDSLGVTLPGFANPNPL